MSEKVYTKEFIKKFREFLSILQQSVLDSNNEWTVKGFIDIYKNVFAISADTKIVSKLLEIHLFPTIHSFAQSIGYRIITTDKQNYYPDLTFENIENPQIKFAVDIKTTYRRKTKNKESINGFTLGSHGRYFLDRSSKKNIQFPYREYTAHFCLAIVYTQVNPLDDEERNKRELYTYRVKELGTPLNDEKFERALKEIDSIQEIDSVIKDIKFYFVEKWKIASDSQGSGNTANIGSVKTETSLKNESGVFSKLGIQRFDEYWMMYNSFVPAGKDSCKINSIWNYLYYYVKDDSIFSKVGDGAKKVPDELKHIFQQTTTTPTKQSKKKK